MSLIRPATILVCVLVVLAGCGGPGDGGGDNGTNDTGVDEQTTEELEGNGTGNDTGVGNDTEGNDTGIGNDTEGNDTGVGNDTGIGNETEGNETGIGNDTNATGDTIEADTGDLDVEQVRNNHTESLREAGSAMLIIDSEMPDADENHKVKLDIDNERIYRTSEITPEGQDEQEFAYYTQNNTTWVEVRNDSGTNSYRVIEGDQAASQEQNESTFGTENDSANDTTGNDSMNDSENESTFGAENDSANDTMNATMGENDSMNHSENDTMVGEENDSMNATTGESERPDTIDDYIAFGDAFTVIQATSWTEEGTVERNGENVTLYTASSADNFSEEGLPESLASEGTQTDNESTFGAENDSANDTMGNDSMNDSENESTFGTENDSANDTMNATMGENDTNASDASVVGNESENATMGNDSMNESDNESTFGAENDSANATTGNDSMNDSENESTFGTENDSANDTETGTQAGQPNVTDYSAVLEVNENGTIQRFSYELTVETENGTETVEESYTFVRIGETNVTEPGWLGNAIEETGVEPEGWNDSGETNETDGMNETTGNESGDLNETAGNESGDFNESGGLNESDETNTTAGNESGDFNESGDLNETAGNESGDFNESGGLNESNETNMTAGNETNATEA